MATGFITQQADRGTVGGSSNGVPANYIVGEKFAVPADAATVTELGAYCDESGAGAGSGTFRIALYSVDGDGDLDNLVGAVASSKDPPTSAGWIEWTGLSIDVSAYQSGTLAICVWADDGNLDLEGSDNTSGNEEYKNYGSPGGTWPWPDLNGDSTALGRQSALYAVYTTGGGGLSIPVAMHHYLHNMRN